MTKIVIRTLLRIDTQALTDEAAKRGKEIKFGDNDGLAKIIFITPDLTTGEKNAFQNLIDKIGTGSVS